MKIKHLLTKTLLVAAGLLVGQSVWAGDKTVVKYSFDDATSPSLTAASEVNFDYTGKSVVTTTNFLNVWSAKNGATGDNNIPLSPNSEDISGKTWTMDYYWAAMGGGNGKAGYIKLMAGETTLFNIADPASGTTMTLNYGESSTASITVAGMNKSKRFSANTKDVYNAKNYWYHITIVGDPTNGVKMTMKSCSDEPATVVENAVLSATNVTPTSLIIKLGSITSEGIDELSLTYYVEGEVVQNPVANYSAVDGIKRTITATCETEGATIQHSTDGVNFEDGASITVSESGNVYFKAVKGTSESDVVTFAAVAGEAITLNTPTIVRSNNTTVTITADQTNLLLSPTATITYEYGNEKGSFTGSKVLTVAADATITAYAEATGYTTSATSERAVALFPTNVEAIENTPTVIKGTTTFALGTDVTTVSGRDYVTLLLDDVQWGKNIYLQNLTLDPIVWGIRNGNWYVNTTENQWVLLRNMKAGDIVVASLDYAAAETVNATYSEKNTYSNRHAYIVDADGDVELAFKKIDAKTMNYIYGFYAYRTVTSVPVTIKTTGTTFSSAYAIDCDNLPDGVTAYKVSAVADSKATLTEVTEAVAPGTGLILIAGTAGSYDLPVAATGNDISATNKLVGVTVAKTVADNEAYGLKDGKFNKLSAGTIPANKAYLPATEVSAPELSIVFGGTTGISEIKTMRNAENEIFFDLQGRKVAQPAKGLYIVNGKKVVIK